MPPPSVAAKSKLADAPPKPGTSSSGQFVIHGADQKTRGEILRHCESVAAEMQALLKDSAEGAIPMVIALRTAPNLNPNAPAVSPNISQLAHGGFHLQINIQLRPDFHLTDLRTELVRLLVVERILREHKSITPKGGILPDWLLVGINEALTFRSRNRPSAVFAAVFRTGKVFGIEDILDVRVSNLDALSRTIYNTSCCALVLTLLEQPEGSLRFRKFLHALPLEERSNRELINEWFPNLALSASSLDKWWSLQMANLSRPNVFETMGPDETATALKNALYFRYASVDSGSSKPRSRSASSTAAAKPKSEEPAAEKPEEKSPEPGFIRRLFRRDTGKDEPEKTEPDPKPKEEPKAKPEPEPETTGDKPSGPSLMRRLFGGDDKEDAEPEEKPSPKTEDSKKTTQLLRQTTLGAIHPMLVLVAGNNFGFLNTDPGRLTVTIFGLGKKKTPEEIAAEEKEKADKAAAKAKAEEERAMARAAEKAKEAEEDAARDAARKKAKEEKEAAKASKDSPPTPEKSEEEPKAPPPPKPATSKPKPSTATIVTIPFDEFAKIASRKDVKAICASAANNLNILHTRAHPLFRSVITGYIGVLGAISEGKTKEVPQMLAELKLAAEGALSQAKAVQAHLDWYEAQHTKGLSGQFDDYLRLPQTIKKELPPRNDVISQHLDAIEQEQSTAR